MDRLQTTSLGVLSALLLAAPVFACEVASEEPARAQVAAPRSVTVVSPRAGKIRDFPCEQCHVHIGTSTWGDGDAPRKHRSIVVDHFDGADSCGICHDADNRDRLGLLRGETVSFDEAHILCGQCHSEKLRDWKIGAHGKHVGGWSGVKHRLACADCHDPHSPGHDMTTALPAPPFPKFGIPKGDH